MRNGKKAVLVINGPNLNLLGTREPHLYGYETLDDVETAGKKQGQELNSDVGFFQRSAAIHLHPLIVTYNN
jgi:3-dehydroquinate dehydratase-2